MRAYDYSTSKKMTRLGLKIRRSNLRYSSNMVHVTVGSFERSVGVIEAGGEREMFYAAAGFRNFYEKYDKEPTSNQISGIFTRAKSAHKTRKIWEKRYNLNSKIGSHDIIKDNTEFNLQGSVITPLRELELVLEETLSNSKKIPIKKKEHKMIKTTTQTTLAATDKTKIRHSNRRTRDVLRRVGATDVKNITYDDATPSTRLIIRVPKDAETYLQTQIVISHAGNLKSAHSVALELRRIMTDSGRVPNKEEKRIIIKKLATLEHIATTEQCARKTSKISKTKMKTKDSTKVKTKSKAKVKTSDVIKGLRLDIDSKYISLSGDRVYVQVPVGSEIKRVAVPKRHGLSLRHRFKLASLIRDFILENLKIPTKEVIEDMLDKVDAPVVSAEPKQKPKLEDTPLVNSAEPVKSLWSRFKGLFT